MFSSQRTLIWYAEESSYLNMKMVAELKLHKEDKVEPSLLMTQQKWLVVQSNIKTGITVADPKESFRTFTTGHV